MDLINYIRADRASNLDTEGKLLNFMRKYWRAEAGIEYYGITDQYLHGSIYTTKIPLKSVTILRDFG